MSAPRVATCNAKKELSARDAHKVVQAVTAEADAVLWQEIETPGHRAAVSALGPDWFTWWPGGAPNGHPANACPISYRRSFFPKLARQGKSVLVMEGEEGVSPNRYINDIVPQDRDGLNWPLLSTHFIAQSWTSKPNRRPRWNSHAAKLSRRMTALRIRWGRAVGGADTNRPRWAPKGTAGIWGKGPTFEGRFYDVIFASGKVVRGSLFARRIETPSDHDALVIRLVGKR